MSIVIEIQSAEASPACVAIRGPFRQYRLAFWAKGDPALPEFVAEQLRSFIKEMPKYTADYADSLSRPWEKSE